MHTKAAVSWATSTGAFSCTGASVASGFAAAGADFVAAEAEDFEPGKEAEQSGE